MEQNRLAKILEESLKADGAYDELPVPIPPSAPRGNPQNRVFKFQNPSKEDLPPPNPSSFNAPSSVFNVEPKPFHSIETPKFVSEKPEAGLPKPSAIPQQKEPDSATFVPKSSAFPAIAGLKSTKVVKVEEEDAPDILNDDEFEIDGMGEVWEYAGHSANVNQNEESGSSSDEFDPNSVVVIRVKEKKAEVKLESGGGGEGNDIERSEKISEEMRSKNNEKFGMMKKVEVKKVEVKKKRVDLKTRGMQAEARIQQMEMKEKVAVVEDKSEEKEEQNRKDEVFEWDNISIKEIDEVVEKESTKKEEKAGSKNIPADQAVIKIGSYPVSFAPPQPPRRRSFFARFFSCFHGKD